MSTGGPESTAVAATPEEVWAVLEAPVVLAALLPGVESAVADGPRRFRAVLANRVLFMIVRIDLAGEFQPDDPGRSGRLVMRGLARGFGGGFDAEIPITIEPRPDGPTTLHWDVVVRIDPALASLAGDGIRDQVRDQVGALVGAVEAEIRRRRAVPPTS